MSSSRRHLARIHGSLLFLLAASCAGPVHTSEPRPPAADDDDDGDDGIDETQLPLLASSCTITTSALTLKVADGETALLRLRAFDGKITANAKTTSNGPCEVPASFTVTVTAWGTTAAVGRVVILDYGDGVFPVLTTAPTVVIDLSVVTNGSNDAVKIRATGGVDSFAIGNGGGTSMGSINLNAGSGGGQDSTADITLKQVEKVVINGAAGHDVLTAAGGFGTGTVFPGIVNLFGGLGNDTLTGGSGNDLINGGKGNDTMDGVLGNDTIVMGRSGDGTDIANCTGAPTGSDTVDYSLRTADLALYLDDTASSGELSENDTLSAAIITVIAGAGSDAITIDDSSTLNHVITGGAGDDIMIGSPLGHDSFDGQDGDDTCVGLDATMTYATRSTGVTVSICDPSGDCTMSSNDGDQTLTTTRKSGTVATAADDGTPSDLSITISGLAGISANDIGRRIKLSGFATTANNETTNGYLIMSRTTTTVTVNVGINGSFDENSLAAASVPAGLTWSIVGAEKDNVGCGTVIGTAQADTIAGDARNNTIRGGAGVDNLSGGAGHDYLYGDAGDDSIWAGAGDDHLSGGNDNDTMYGGDDDDILEGGAGTDGFTCDGPNSSGGPTGSAPGTTDFTVDVGVTDTTNADCLP